jgi:hypothetical protein
MKRLIFATFQPDLIEPCILVAEPITTNCDGIGGDPVKPH